MPTESFYKLDNEKRKKILEAMKKEFSRVPFHEASINKIVEEAGISKGSFWVYFKSKEEAIEYLVESHVEKERKKAKRIFEKNNGDLFKSYIEIYEYLQKHEVKKVDRNLMINIFKNILANEDKFLKEGPPNELIDESLKSSIDITEFDLQDENDFMNLIKMLNYSMRTNLLDVMTKKTTHEEARKRFVRELEILKKGISK